MNNDPIFSAVVTLLAERYGHSPNYVESLLRQKLSGVTQADDIAMALGEVKRQLAEQKEECLLRRLAHALGDNFEQVGACSVTPGVDGPQILFERPVEKVVKPHVLPKF